jgi:hypothetical protein
MSDLADPAARVFQGDDVGNVVSCLAAEPAARGDASQLKVRIRARNLLTE